MNQIISFKDDPSLGFKTVKTVNGETEYRRNCKKITKNGTVGYYVINKDCFEVDGTWYRVASGLIVFDAEKNAWVLKKGANLIEGVIGVEKNGKPKMGHYTPNPYKNTSANFGAFGVLPVINTDVLIESGFVENFSTGIWFPPGSASAEKLQTPKNAVDHRNKGYNIEDNAVEFEQKKKLFAEFVPQMSKDVMPFGKMLGDTTFGIELECSKGFLPEHIQNQTGVVICRDGSLRDENGMPGPEYVTVPMGGLRCCRQSIPYLRKSPKGIRLILTVPYMFTWATCLPQGYSL